MNSVQAKAKLAEISRSTATKHPKVLISELCGIVQFLLGEIERIKTPKMTELTNLPTSPDPIRYGPLSTPWRSPPPFRPDTQPPIKRVIPTEFKQPPVDETESQLKDSFDEPFTETGPPLRDPKVDPKKFEQDYKNELDNE